MRRMIDLDTTVECCGTTQSVNRGRSSIHGWPKCPKCGTTMRPNQPIGDDSPALKRAIGQ